MCVKALQRQPRVHDRQVHSGPYGSYYASSRQGCDMTGARPTEGQSASCLHAALPHVIPVTCSHLCTAPAPLVYFRSLCLYVAFMWASGYLRHRHPLGTSCVIACVCTLLDRRTVVPFAGNFRMRECCLNLRQVLLCQALTELEGCNVLRQVFLPLGACIAVWVLRCSCRGLLDVCRLHPRMFER